jgi:putative copper resistance protein D
VPDEAPLLFDLGQGGLPLALVQGFAVAALVSAFGALLFLAFLAPPALAGIAPHQRATVTRPCRWLARLSLLLAMTAEGAWLVMESATIAGTDTVPQAFAAVPAVLSDTEFGHLIVTQMLLLVVAALVFGRTKGGARLYLAVVPAGLATVLQAWHLHAAAMANGVSVLLVCEVLHVSAAGAWLGALLPLALLVRTAPPEVGSIASRRFAPFGSACVLVLAITAFWQGLVLVGGLHTLVATAYGWIALVKLVLFAVLIGFAWHNHFRLTPLLRGADPIPARHALERNIVREAGIGLVIVLGAAVLASLSPGRNMTMP